MIKIMNTAKALPDLVSDNTNGLGQIEPINAFVTEELNGVYELNLSVPADDKHFPELAVGGILKATVNEAGDEQLFRIVAITKPINSICNIECNHITYDLNKVAVKPFTATGSVAAKNGMISNIIGSYPFTMTTDIVNTTSKFTLDIPRSFRECLGGYEGSLLDVFRGEYEYDNLTVKMLAHRGSDNGVRIAYGKNLTNFVQDEQMDNVYTSVLGYATVDDVTYTGDVYHKVSATYPKVLIVDFSLDYEMGEIPTTAQLTAKAQAYAEANDIEVPKVNMEISFVPLYQTEEYKDIAPLERVSLGDTVHVYFDKLGVEASARVIKTEWNVLLGRYESVELGDAKANLNTIIQETAQQTKTEVTDSQGFLESQMNQMASLIINGLGLHRTLVPVEGGGYRIYLHNKETLAQSDTQYIFTSEGFLVSTDYGQTWNAGFDADGNAVLNSLATITLKALEIQGGTITGSTIIFGNPNSQNITAQPNSGNNGIEFVGTGKINFQSTNTFDVLNGTSAEKYNELHLEKSQWRIYNYDDYLGGYTSHKIYASNGSDSHVFVSVLYDLNRGSDDLYTRAAELRLQSTSSYNTAYLQLLDGSTNTIKANVNMSYNKSTGKSSISITADDVYVNGTKIG